MQLALSALILDPGKRKQTRFPLNGIGIELQNTYNANNSDLPGYHGAANPQSKHIGVGIGIGIGSGIVALCCYSLT
jgi:hypothetical protein